jgi:hypothetical protein
VRREDEADEAYVRNSVRPYHSSGIEQRPCAASALAEPHLRVPAYLEGTPGGTKLSQKLPAIHLMVPASQKY